MLAAATTLNESSLPIWVCGGVGVLLFFWFFAIEVKRSTRLIGALAILFMGVAAIAIPALLTPKKTVATHGGTVLSLRIQSREDEHGAKLPVTKAQLSQAISVLQRRLKNLGTRDAQVTPNGTDGIVVEIPGANPEAAKSLRDTLQKPGNLELHEVNPRNDEPGPDGKSLAARVAANQQIVPGYKVFTYRHKDMDGNQLDTPILLNRRAALGGKDIALAVPSQQQADAVSITLNSEGADKMIALTKDMTPSRDRIAIVLDGEVISAPSVRSVPLGKDFIIEGLRQRGEPAGLANALMCPLEVPVVIEEEHSVPPPTDAK